MQKNRMAFENTYLENLAKAVAALGFKTKLFAKEPPLTGPLLHIVLPKDQEGRERGLNVLFVPVQTNNQLNHLTLIQLFAPAPFAIKAEKQQSLVTFLQEVNYNQPVGHFGLGKTGNLFYRYVLSTEKNPWTTQASIQQLLLLIIHQLDTTFPLLEKVTNQ